METITYTCRVRDANAVLYEIPLISVKATAFSETVPAQLSSYRRLLCMNVKQPNRLRVLNRHGKYAEKDVNVPMLRHLVSSEGYLDHCAFFAVGGDQVLRLKSANDASGEIELLLREVNLNEEVYAVTVGRDENVYVLGRSHIFEVNMEKGVKVQTMDLALKTVVKSPVIDYHCAAKLLIAPAKQNCLDLISTNTRRSVLPKVWEPHANSSPTAAFFIQRRNYGNDGDGNIFIVTAACGNTELRLWTYNTVKQTFTLIQHLCLTVETDDEDTVTTGGEEESFLISRTSADEYITLCSKRHPLAVVVELHRSNFKIDRITSWKLKDPAIASSAMMGKIADSTASGSVGYQLILAVRTATGFCEEVLNVDKLIGASNTAAIKQNSVAAWFPQKDVKGNNTPASLSSGLTTAVSSSVLGDKTTNAISQGVASRIVRQQASLFCDKLHSIDDRVVDLQKRASVAMRLLQESRAREEAQTIGRKFAARNKGRLELLQQQQQQQQQLSLEADSSGILSRSQQQLMEQIRSVVEEVDPAAADSARQSVKTLLSRHLKDAVAKGMKEAEQTDLGIVTPSIRSTDSMRVFSNGVDSSMQVLMRAIKSHYAMMQTPIAGSAAASTKCVSNAKQFLLSVKREMELFSDEIKETKNVMSQMSNVVEQVDPDVLVSRAVAAAEAKDWGKAFMIALEASDITVLLAFLESKVCEDNLSTIVRPHTISLPTFLSLCLHLSFELELQSGSIPLRIRLLHLFFVEWDDTLKEMRQKATEGASQEKQIFDLTRRELSNVLDQLSTVDELGLDRQSRNRIRLLKRLIGFLITES